MVILDYEKAKSNEAATNKVSNQLGMPATKTQNSSSNNTQ